VGQTLAELIDSLNDERERAHFGAIAEHHPDFNDVAGSQGFHAYLMAMPEDERTDAQRIVDGGTAKEIIGLLSAFKKSQHQGESNDTSEPDDDALDAAEGVRSAGLKLPEQPAMGGSYEEAWDRF
jgi:hypothetical protein